MARKSKPEQDDPKQSKRFEETARELGADADAQSFADAIDAVVKQSPILGNAEKPPTPD